jgi:hypothetical protein
MSKEHFATRGIFLSEVVTVGGLPYLKGQRKDVGIDSLVTKTLCEGHNNALSPVDQALVDLVNSIREIDRIRQVRARIRRRHHTPCRFVVDGVRIERCVLKWAMNLARVFKAEMDEWEPPSWMADVIFGRSALRHGAGLAMLARVGDGITDTEAVKFTFGTTGSNKHPAAVILELRNGYRLFCSWSRPVSDYLELRVDGNVYSPMQHALYHPVRMNFEERNVSLALSLDFDWSGTWTEKKHANVVGLRHVYRAPPRK